jgi:hypothetical protein
MKPETIEWLNALRNIYDNNPVRAILIARLEYTRLDREALIALGYDARRLQDQAYAAEVINTRMGMFGAAPQAINTTAAHLAQAFSSTMGMIAFSGGDPPCTRAIQERALDILGGKVSIDEQIEILKASSQERGYGNLISDNTLNLLTGPLFGMFAKMLLTPLLMQFAALGLPRPQLMAIMGVEAPPPTTKKSPHKETLEQVRERFRQEMADGESASTEHPSESVDHFLKALEVATSTPETEDDKAALSHLWKLLRYQVFSTEDLVKIVKSILPFVDREDMSDITPSLLYTLGIKVLGIADNTLCEPVAEAVSKFISAYQCDEKFQTKMSLVGIYLWLKSGHNNRAKGLLADIKKEGFPKELELNVVLAEADVLIDSGSQDEACTLLRISMLRSKYASDKSLHSLVLTRLLNSCPYSEEEGRQWREELEILESQKVSP